MNKIGYIAFFLLFNTQCCFYAQSIFGKWKTIDDRSGIVKGVVEVYEEKGLMQGRIVKILQKGKEEAICRKCKGDQKGKPILGMKIIHDFKKSDKGEYKGTKLFDPEQGMTFRGKIWLDPENPDKLMVRGYLAFLYRTQTWHRVKE
ncbi:MAG: DUF2147 domain-containing protein [Bacteroidota bacterium]